MLRNQGFFSIIILYSSEINFFELLAELAIIFLDFSPAFFIFKFIKPKNFSQKFEIFGPQKSLDFCGKRNLLVDY
jgi:hypothetical protein